MIPKNIFFIWFGNELPKYFAMSMNMFSSINKDFTIQLIYRTYKDLNDIRHGIFKQIYDAKILQNMIDIENNSGLYKESILYYKNLKRSKIQILSNIFRLYLLNNYGGIYIDGDCFPIKPFDDQLLKKSFVIYHKYNSDKFYPDCFFMGKEQINTIMWKSYQHGAIYAKHLIQKESNTKKCNKLILQKKFINCKLSYGEFFSSSQNYLDHYNLKIWQH